MQLHSEFKFNSVISFSFPDPLRVWAPPILTMDWRPWLAELFTLSELSLVHSVYLDI